MITDIEIKFYKENGYLIIQNFLTEEKVDELDRNYDNLRKDLAKQASIDYSDYQQEISQIRDIWKYDKTYRDLILENEIAEAAPLLFEDKSCRLLHDHIINKPINNNSIIPWHQDYTYWPTDNPNGLSLWLSFSDLDKNGGVLEIVPQSHTWGEEAPVDFMNDAKDFSKYDIKSLTVNKGDLVILE
jgi:phytanoyl-CoA hydroxylase